MKLVLNKKIEILLGAGLATGSFTSFRILGPVGLSELLILLVIFLLLIKYFKKIFFSPSYLEACTKFYLLFAFFLFLPITTITTFSLDISLSSPVYIISYIMGLLLILLLALAIQDGFDFRIVTITFAVIFISLNSLALILFGSDGGARFSGGADNPNQLLFYGSSLSLLLVIYTKKLQFLFLPLLILIMIKTGSDAYMLSLFVSVSVFIIAKILMITRLSYISSLVLAIPLVLVLIYIGIIVFGKELLILWESADEGGTRISLFTNAIRASFDSPLFGFGAGSFSGFNSPFEGKEAHNTFLDFLTQFGFFVPFLMYFLMVAFFFSQLRSKQYWVSGFVASYIVGSLFHFSGRHFVFWVELAVFYHSFFYGNSKSGKK